MELNNSEEKPTGNEQVDLLLFSKRDELDFTDDGCKNIPRKRIHQAALDGDVQTMQELHKEEPECINEEDSRGQRETSLHFSAKSGKVEVLRFLLSQENIKISQNRKGMNALDIAVERHHRDYAMEISNHGRWREFLHPKANASDLTQLQLMVVRMPDIAESFLDKFYVTRGDPEDEDLGESSSYSIYYDFSLLHGMADIDKDDPRRFDDALKTMVDHKRLGCLTHPVCFNYMKHKWQKVGWWMFLINLVLYILFLSCLTSLAMLLQHRGPGPARIIRIPRILVMILSIMQLLKEFAQIIDLKHRHFLELENWLEILLYTITLVSTIVYGDYENEQRTPRELRGTMAFATFLAWSVFVLYLRGSAAFGIYIIMMIKIVVTLLEVMVLFLPFMCAFGLPFYIIFDVPEKPPGKAINETSTKLYLFDNAPYSLWTTFMMLLGEMKYPHTLYKYQPLKYPHITYIIYTIFVLCMPIIIKNLLIGLAVGDIKCIKASARLQHLSAQVKRLVDFDKTVPRRFLRTWLVTEITEYPHRDTPVIEKLTSFGFPRKIERSVNKKGENHPIAEIADLNASIGELKSKLAEQDKRMEEMLRVLREVKSEVSRSRLPEDTNNEEKPAESEAI